VTRTEISALRSEIEKIDSEIVQLIARREEVSSELGLIKEKDGTDVRDLAREREVLSRFSEEARLNGVDRALAQKMARLLIEDSVRVQKIRKTKGLAARRGLVIGGSGRMGGWTCRFLSDRGARVSIWDPRGRLDGYDDVKSIEQGAKGADIIVVASPLGACSDDLDKVIEARPTGLVFDLCSVKAHISGQLRKAARGGLKITSIHPMFGPVVPSPKGQNVLVCGCGCAEADDEVSRIFSSAGANVSKVSLEKHDELMAYVLGLSHLCTLLFASTLERSGIRLAELDAVQGPSFKRLSSMASELSHESKRVYHDIQALNPHTRHLISAMETVLRDVKRASLDNDHSGFSKIMEADRRYFEVRQDG
jgi:chorismate mutase/prephenate dehydrogenase